MKLCISQESFFLLCPKKTCSCKVKPEGCPFEGIGRFISFSCSLCVPPFSRASLHGQVPAGVLWLTLCSPGSPGCSTPYTWYLPTICLMCSQQSGHAPMLLWGGFSTVPLQRCAEPSCLWWMLHASSAQLQAAAGWHRLQQLLLGGGVAHLPVDTEQAEKC